MLNEEIGEYEENRRYHEQKADDIQKKFDALQKTKDDLDEYYKRNRVHLIIKQLPTSKIYNYRKLKSP